MNLRKAGALLFIITIVLLFLSRFVELDLNMKLFLGAFGLVGGIILMTIGKIEQ